MARVQIANQTEPRTNITHLNENREPFLPRATARSDTRTVERCYTRRRTRRPVGGSPGGELDAPGRCARSATKGTITVVATTRTASRSAPRIAAIAADGVACSPQSCCSAVTTDMQEAAVATFWRHPRE